LLRYTQLFQIVRKNKCRSILEIGTHDGNTAKRLIHSAALASPQHTILYYGVDLFEDYAPDTTDTEFNGKKKPESLNSVEASLKNYINDHNLNAAVYLTKGNSRDVLKKGFLPSKVDFCFVDGGHSKETIQHDIDFAIANSKIVVADDYYTSRDDVGCNSYVSKSREPWFLLPFMDSYGGNSIAMAVSPITAYPWTRYAHIYALLKQESIKKVALCATDPFLEENVQVLAKVFGYELIPDPTECHDLDFAVLQFTDSEEEARMLYGMCNHAKAIIIDGINGDVTTGYAGLGIKLLEEDGKQPIFPQSADVCTLAIWPQGDAQVNLQVKTRNCVPNEDIAANVRANTPLIERWCMPCEPHTLKAVVVSAGASIKDANTIAEIKRLSELDNVRIFCVKHSHDILIKNGIVPFGCLLLDPRDHVKHFVENPHKDTIYFVATMCHNNTLKKLLDKGAQVIGYNARVGDNLDAFLEHQDAGMCVTIPGGSASSTRGIAVLHLLGFRDFECFGYDLYFDDKPRRNTKTHQGFDKIVKVEYNGKEFWSDLELIAQADDIKNLYKTIDKCKLNDWSNVNLKFHGDNLGQHVARSVSRFDYKYSLNDVLKGIDARKLPAPTESEHTYKIIS